MTTSVPHAVKQVGVEIVAAGKAEVEAVLSKLGHDSAEARRLGAELLEFAMEIGVAKLRGHDTDFAEGAMSSAIYSLRSVASTEACAAIVAIGQRLLRVAIAAPMRVLSEVI